MTAMEALMRSAYDRLAPLTARLVRRELRSLQDRARDAWASTQPAGSFATFNLEPRDSSVPRDGSRGGAWAREHTATDGWLEYDTVTVFFDRRRGFRTEEGTRARFSVHVQHEGGHYQSLGGRLVIQPEPGSKPDYNWMIDCPGYELLDPRWLIDEGEILETSRATGIDEETWTIRARPSPYIQAPAGLRGASEYRGVFDAGRGVLLTLSGWFEGEQFASLELIDLAFDVDLPDETFRLS